MHRSLVTAALTACSALSALQGQLLQGQLTVANPSNPATTSAHTVAPPSEVVVQFKAHLEVRRGEDETLADRRTGSALPRIAGLLGQRKMRRVFAPLSVSDIDQMRQELSAPTDEPLPDLNNFYRIATTGPDDSARLIARLLADPLVETAYARAALVLHGDLSPFTPSFQSKQGYFGPAPSGYGYESIESIVGARFQGSELLHLEGDWEFGHEDLASMVPSSLITGLPDQTLAAWKSHGSAVAGILAADRNGYGVRGFASGGRLLLASIGNASASGQSIASVILQAVARLRPGAVMVSALGFSLPNGAQAPLDFEAATFAAIQFAERKGIYYVLSAGNSGDDLGNTTVYGSRYTSSAPSSGAIIVGATEGSSTAKQATSCYGMRVDANGWGSGVATLGGNADLFFPNFDDRQTYTQSFSGTSAATPAVAGVIASYTGAVLEQSGLRLTPAQVRADLRRIGTPVSGQIGRRPDLTALLAGRGLPDGLVINRQGTVGGSFEATLRGRPGEATILAIAPRRIRVPSPWNRPVLVDALSGAIVPLRIGPSGTARPVFSIPNNTTLSNVTVFLQSFTPRGSTTFASNSAEAWIAPNRGRGPAAPTGLKIANFGRAFAELSWQDNANNESGYAIGIQTINGSLTEVGRIGPNQTGYRVSGLQPETIYYAKVWAFNAAGNSPYAVAGLRTRDAASPTGPTNLRVTEQRPFRINIAWTDNSQKESGFNIALSGDGTNFNNVGSTGASVPRYSITGLEPDKPYWIKVRAFRDINNTKLYSAYSNTVVTRTTDGKPRAPTNLTSANVKAVRLGLRWIDNADNEDGFNISISRDGTNFNKRDSVTTDITKYPVTNLQPLTRYWFRVRAFRTVNNQVFYSDYTNTLVVSTTDGRPAAPTTLTITDVKAARLKLSWIDHADDELGFNISRSKNQVNWNRIDTVDTDKQNYLATGLTPDTTYYFRVRAFRTVQNQTVYSDYSNVAQAKTLDGSPAAPTGLQPVQVKAVHLGLRWTDNSDNEEGFNIALSRDGTNFNKRASVGPDVTQHRITNLIPVTRYWFKVRAYRTINSQVYYSDYSNTLQLTTTDGSPANPTGLATSNAQETRLDLNWIDNADDEAGYNVSISRNRTSWNRIQTLGANATSYRVSGLVPDTTYYFRVRCFRTVQSSTVYSNYSNIASARTKDGKPAPPSSLSTTNVRVVQLGLRWVDRSTDEDGFQVVISTNGSSYSAKASVGRNTTAYNATQLNPATSYWFKVRAYRIINSTRYYSAYSNAASATTNAGTPADPTNLRLTAKRGRSFDIAWTDNSNNEDTFNIAFSRDGNSFNNRAKLPANRTTYRVDNLQPLTSYWVKVRAQNSRGYSSYTNTLMVTTGNVIPSPPSNLRATGVRRKQVDLRWADNSTNEDGFNIAVSKDNANFNNRGRTGPNATTFTVTDLDRNTRYYIKIRARNAIGLSAYSNTIVITTN